MTLDAGQVDQVCEDLTGAECEVDQVELPGGLEASDDFDAIEIGPRGAAILYIDWDGELRQHEWDLSTAPRVFASDGIVFLIGPSIRLTDLGIEG